MYMRSHAINLIQVYPMRPKSAHVVGIDTARRAIFDHEDTRTLPLTQSGLNTCFGGTDTCLGLGEVREVVIQLEDLKKRTFEEIE